MRQLLKKFYKFFLVSLEYNYYDKAKKYSRKKIEAENNSFYYAQTVDLLSNEFPQNTITWYEEIANMYSSKFEKYSKKEEHFMWKYKQMHKRIEEL